MTQTDLLQANIKALTIFNANNTMLTVDECAKFLKVHPNTVKNRIHKHTIQAIFQDGKYHIPKIQFLEKLVASFEE
ncbi:conserved hypothetical protein [Tenacibaculum maritimum]|uniref:helix-turn-helix domain-containing protein n=1 Tax=Tenacibaculum TaxID=104267 RepID=UPI0012E43528|nr:helix-turn-helix domain-containing protein [Tenacibaculum maritimum]CAA0177525.1 conserved hypothetical protein [Tenacibaculum maritimum]